MDIKEMSDNIKLLLVEDDEDFSQALVRRLKKRNIAVERAASAEAALEILAVKGKEFNAVVSDIKLTGMSGTGFLGKVRELHDSMPVIMLTGYASLESAREAVRLHAADYLLKPLENIEELIDPIQKAAYGYQLLQDNKQLIAELQQRVEERTAELQKSRDELAELNRELEKKVAERTAMLIQTTRMAEIGGLASGVAHEFNNIIGIIEGYAQMAEVNNEQGYVREALKMIQECVIRGKDVTQSLLGYAGKLKSKKQPSDIREIIRRTLLLISRSFAAANVEVVEEYHEAPKIVVDPAQMQQVFLNIAINALDAMRPNKGGRLTIYVGKSDDAVEIRFSDNGEGIAEENLPKVFQPFFTTKGVLGGGNDTKGTGLGLSVCKGIIEDHQGKIEARSKLGEGSVFTIKLPVGKEA